MKQILSRVKVYVVAFCDYIYRVLINTEIKQIGIFFNTKTFLGFSFIFLFKYKRIYFEVRYLSGMCPESPNVLKMTRPFA